MSILLRMLWREFASMKHMVDSVFSSRPCLTVWFVLGMVLMVGILHPVSAETSSCIQGKICVSPGNYLKYHTSSFGNNSTFTINFESLVDQNNIRVATVTSTDNGTVTTENILNLNNGTLSSSDGTSGQFRYIANTPIDPQKIGQPGIRSEISSFNGVNRMALGLHIHNQTNSFDLDVDSQTGVLLNFDVLNTQYLSAQTVTTGVVIQLLDTNMFTSSKINTVTLPAQSNAVPLPSKSNNVVPPVQGTIVPQPTKSNSATLPVQSNDASSSVPQWIRNIAKMWSAGELNDYEFVRGMQYLISHDILKVPPTSLASYHSQSIPNWIRQNAGWWASGQISDDDFLKGMQYLVQVGIISL